MQIHFGHPSTENSKISPTLKDKGVNLLRAAPTNIPIVGLYRIQQKGYESYSQHLPAFMMAMETGKLQSISGRGYPLSIGFDKLIPFNYPRVYALVKKGKKPVEVLGTKSWEEYMPRPGGVACLVNFDKSIVLDQLNTKIDTRARCADPFVRYCDTPAMITISRIVSSFLRVHKFPAFSDPEHFEQFRLEELQETRSRTYEDDRVESDPKRRRIEEVQSGDGIIHGKYETSVSPGKKTKIQFFAAKPQLPSLTPWGEVNSIPATSGIHFPYVPELAKPDMETVPRVIEQYFIRSLHVTTEGCMKNYSDLVQAWKSSIASTQWGKEMSHLFRVIEVGLRAQARPFPVIEGNQYLGCFLSGDGYSVAVGSEVYRPTPHDQCILENTCYSTSTRIAEEIAQLVVADDDAAQQAIIERCRNSGIRVLAGYITSMYVLSEETWEKVERLACELRTGQVYKSVNAVNVAWALKGIASGLDPEDKEPMYGGAMRQTDIFSLYLSAFGPLAPSPHIPGAPVMKLQPRLPDKFGKVIGMRLVTLSQSVQDWKNAARDGFVNNGPTNLSAPYEYATVVGNEAKELWFSSVFQFSEWYKAKGSVGKTKEVSSVEEQGGVPLNTMDAGFDFGGL